jgi:hypothetical protein
MARVRVAVPSSGRLDCGSGGYRFTPLGWRGLATKTRAGTRRPLRLHRPKSLHSSAWTQPPLRDATADVDVLLVF